MNQKEKKVRKVTEGTQTDAFMLSKDKGNDSENFMRANFRFKNKKTGKDAFTQINRFDFFNFDKEVKPIIEVLCMKTLQQSLLEVYEEEVLDRMQMYKETLHSKTKTKIIYENRKRRNNQ